MDIIITAITCLVIGFLLGALVITHPIASRQIASNAATAVKTEAEKVL